MSIDYRSLRNIRACQLFDGRLEEFDVYENVNLRKIGVCQIFDGPLEEFDFYKPVKPDMTTATERCLTDRRNYLWVFIGNDGFVTSFTRWAPNGNPRKILNAVGEVFDTCIVSEHEPQYWGFDTQEEWRSAWAKEAREDRKAARKFEIELLKYVRGEPNGIKPGTDHEAKAKIAKNLVEEDSTLLLQVNLARLRSEIKSIYDREVRRIPF